MSPLADIVDGSDVLSCVDAIGAELSLAGRDLLLELPPGVAEADAVELTVLLRAHRAQVFSLLAHDSDERSAIEAEGGP